MVSSKVQETRNLAPVGTAVLKVSRMSMGVAAVQAYAVVYAAMTGTLMPEVKGVVLVNCVPAPVTPTATVAPADAVV